jgi:hypothetical protein
MLAQLFGAGLPANRFCTQAIAAGTHGTAEVT